MRGLIKASASVFILLGAATFTVAVAAALKAVSQGAASETATYPEIIGFIIALGGLLGGASLVLIGGTAYLLSSIDERIERAISKSSREAPAALFAAAE